MSIILAMLIACEQYKNMKHVVKIMYTVLL